MDMPASSARGQYRLTDYAGNQPWPLHTGTSQASDRDAYYAAEFQSEGLVGYVRLANEIFLYLIYRQGTNSEGSQRDMASVLGGFTIIASLAICIRAANKTVLARRADADSTKVRQGGATTPGRFCYRL